jgi:PKD repeat protein
MKTYYSNKKRSFATWLAAGLFLITSMAIEAQCNANFTYSTYANGGVYLVSTSTGTSVNTSYTWNFGSSQSYGSAVSHTFATNGNHSVCLNILDTVSSPTCSAQYCDTVLITNAPVCQANFSASPGPNGTWYFTSTSTNASAGTTYSWNFGGSSSGTGSSISHTYSTNGVKMVCLTITNSTANCSSTYCDSVLVTNSGTTTPCNASFTYTLGPNGAVYLTSTSTGTFVTTHRNWTFGGSSTGVGSSVTHTYTSNGFKTICLTITDSTSNCNSTYCDSILISNAGGTTTPCTANFIYTMGSNGSVNFASTSTGTSSTTHYVWNFYGSGSGTGLTTSHTFTANGMYIACLTISDSSSNCYDVGCDSIYITNVSTTCSPSVVYYLSKDSTMNLTWDAYATYPSNITGATWYWGDGSSSTGLYPSHTYSAAGTYSTCVTISVSCGSVTATYCYVAAIFKGSQNNDMIVLNVRQAVPTGIKAVAKKDGLLNIYPNPNTGSFTLEQNELSSNSGESRLSIYNMLGEKVFEKNIVSVSKQNIDVSELPNGTYFVKMVSDLDCYTKKISVQK